MQECRLVIQYKNDLGRFVNSSVVLTKELTQPQSIQELGLNHEEQLDILQKVQDDILQEQTKDLSEDIHYCPRCGTKLRKNGLTKSVFNSIFTDHKVAVHRKICGKCRWSSVPSVDSLFGTHRHPDLIRMQCEESAKHSYSKAQEILNRKSIKKRAVNNTMNLSKVVERVGNYIATNPTKVKDDIKEADNLYLQIDGGHLPAKDKSLRSFEVLTSVVYSPDNVKKVGKSDRGEITSKHSAASALDDNQEHIKAATLLAAKKEGMTLDTHVTALCDGASNCWSIVDYIKSHCKSVVEILDWFHIAMKFKNVGSLENSEQDELLKKAKWSLWHGNVKKFYDKIIDLITSNEEKKTTNKLNKLYNYIRNNSSRIVNYQARKDKGLTFTSNIAENTVSNLINQRCKGKKHMQWSREGIHPLLQIRAAGQEWVKNAEEFILGAYQKTA